MPTPPPTGRASVPLPDGRRIMDGFARWTLSAVQPQAERVPYVRQQALHVFQLWQIDDDLTWAGELLLTELATHAVRHARTPSRSCSAGMDALSKARSPDMPGVHAGR
jgi:hypothetical protein